MYTDTELFAMGKDRKQRPKLLPCFTGTPLIHLGENHLKHPVSFTGTPLMIISEGNKTHKY
jgi:hypothetical protein